MNRNQGCATLFLVTLLVAGAGNVAADGRGPNGGDRPVMGRSAALEKVRELEARTSDLAEYFDTCAWQLKQRGLTWRNMRNQAIFSLHPCCEEQKQIRIQLMDYAQGVISSINADESVYEWKAMCEMRELDVLNWLKHEISTRSDLSSIVERLQSMDESLTESEAREQTEWDDRILNRLLDMDIYNDLLQDYEDAMPEAACISGSVPIPVFGDFRL